MSDITVNTIMLFTKGIPEGMLAVLALHIFTRTTLEKKKYFFLCFVYIAATYLIRFLPIALGVNTILSLFVLIVAFQFTHKTQLSKVTHTIAASIALLILIAVSEVLNMFLLIALFGQSRAEQLFTSENGFIQSLYTSPSSIFFAFFIFSGHLLLKAFETRKIKNGKTGQ